jgi:hypothetical protein
MKPLKKAVARPIKCHSTERQNMDVALTNSIIHTASALAQARTSEAVNISVLKQAMDTQEITAATLLEAVQLPTPAPALATSGSLGTLVNTFA